MAHGRSHGRVEPIIAGLEPRHSTFRRRINGFLAYRPAAFILSTPFLVVWTVVVLFLFITRMKYALSPAITSRAEFNAELDVFAGRIFIFCVNPGRAGSKYLQAVLKTAKNTIALHEPRPKMNDEILRSVIIEGRRQETFSSRLSTKLGAIADVLYGTAENVHYAETSHMFVKTFSDVLLHKLADSASEVVILYLRRDLTDIILSQLHLGWFQGLHSGYKAWYYKVEDVHHSERVLRDSQKYSGTQLDAAIGYNLDIMKRASKLHNYIQGEKRKGLLKNVKEMNVSIEDLNPRNERGNIERFLKSIGLDPDLERIRLLDQQETNTRDFKKSLIHATVTREDVKLRINQLSEVSLLK